MKPVYADYAAATPTDPRVVKAMAPFFSDNFANPSSNHGYGLESRNHLRTATQTIAQFLNCQENELIYTSGGTESNNLAITGVAKANKSRGQHIITTAIEHPSILNVCQALEKDGWRVTYLPVSKSGLVDPDQLVEALTSETVLVSIHLANAEIGVIQHIAKLAGLAKKCGAYFHTDASQAAAFLELDVEKLGVDLLTFNGGKVYGPKGIAALFIRQNVQIFPIIYGSGQQNSLRSGTENMPGIIGLAEAAKIVLERRANDTKEIGQLRDRLEGELAKLPGVKINGANTPRLADCLSVTFNQAAVTNMVEYFDQHGIAVSSGSACSAKSTVDSHVLLAIGLTSKQIHQTVRISLGRQSTSEDINRILLAAKKI